MSFKSRLTTCFGPFPKTELLMLMPGFMHLLGQSYLICQPFLFKVKNASRLTQCFYSLFLLELLHILLVYVVCGCVFTTQLLLCFFPCFAVVLLTSSLFNLHNALQCFPKTHYLSFSYVFLVLHNPTFPIFYVYEKAI